MTRPTQRIYSGSPVTVVVQASDRVIDENELDRYNGEQFDTIDGVITIENDGKNIMLTSTRTLKAWHKSLPNAGRGEWVFPHDMLECVFVNSKVVWRRHRH